MIPAQSFNKFVTKGYDYQQIGKFSWDQFIRRSDCLIVSLAKFFEELGETERRIIDFAVIVIVIVIVIEPVLI